MRPQVLLSIIVVLVLFPHESATNAQTVDRVETSVALNQVVKKVDPVIPPEAGRVVRINGSVSADVTIAADGTVTMVRVLSGPPMLHAPVQAALAQWTFKPFALQGQARPVIATIWLDLNPITDQEKRDNAALYQCESALEVDAARAVPLCKAAVTAADKLPVLPVEGGAVGMEEMASDRYQKSLTGAGRLPEAVAVLEQLIARRAATGVDLAKGPYYVGLGELQGRLGAYNASEKAFEDAENLYEAESRERPTSGYSPLRLRDVLSRHAAVRRARGDATGAAALDARARAVVIPVSSEPSPADFRRTSRHLDDITILESNEVQITDDDVRRIQALLGDAGIWWMKVDQLFDNQGQQPSVHACGKPVVVTETIRRGRCFSVVKRAPDTSGRGGGWERLRMADDDEYVQMKIGAGNLTAAPLIEVGGRPAPSNDQILAIAALLRSRAVPSPTARLKSDIQPWPMTEIFGSGSSLLIRLGTEDGRSRQFISVRQAGDGWDIVFVN